MKRIDPIALASRLIEFDTSNPPGNESACAHYLGSLLSENGFEVSEYRFGAGRVNLLARKRSRQASRSLCFVGHLDTVPAGAMPWRHPPFSAIAEDGRLYGRGACDMKSGVAAFVTAAIGAVPTLVPDSSLTLLLAGGEETGCEGSLHMALHAPEEFGGFNGVIVAEPTDNKPLLGHKGALWMRLTARGVAAHGAMPQNGINAAVKAARMVVALQDFCAPLPAHPVLGKPTVNVGRIRAGHSINVVPDMAEVDIDLRTTPEVDHELLRERILNLLADDIDQAEILISLPGVFTDPQEPWVQAVFATVEKATGRRVGHETAAYFTDASALRPATNGAPILILGPGSPQRMHKTDEYCELSQITEAERIYASVIAETLACAPAERILLAGHA